MDRFPGARLWVAALAAATLASVFAVAPGAEAATMAVPCDEDALIERIEIANATGGADILILAKKCTYKYEQAYSDNGEIGNALPQIRDDLTIVGRGSKIVRDVDDDLDNFAAFRLLQVGPAEAPDVVLKDLTFSGGLAPVVRNGDDLVGLGGAIFNSASGALELHGVTVKDNEIFVVGSDPSLDQAAGLGGGIVSLGPLELHRSAVVDNEVTAVGFGLESVAAGGGGVQATTALIRKSVIRGNDATQSGGRLGIAAGALAMSPGFDGVGFIEASLDMADSSVTGNTAVTTASELSAGAAGGILLGSAIESATIHRIARSTVSGNVAEAQGGAALAAGGGIVNQSGDPIAPDPCGPFGCALGETLFVDDPDAPGAKKGDQTVISNNRASCDGDCRAVGGGYANFLPVTVPGDDSLPGHAEFWNTVFKGNVADGDDGVGLGGGLFLAGDGTAGPGDDEPETVLHDVTVTKNKVKGDFFKAGGGIFTLDEDAVDIDDSKIFKNKPDDCWNVPLCV